MVNNQQGPSPLCGRELRVMLEEQHLTLEPRVKLKAGIEVRVEENGKTEGMVL